MEILDTPLDEVPIRKLYPLPIQKHPIFPCFVTL